jgi:hypothetical protein
MNLVNGPHHVLVKNAAKLGVTWQARVVKRTIEAGHESSRHLILGPGLRVNQQHRGVPATKSRIGRRSTEDLTEIARESFEVLWIHVVRERMIQNRIFETSFVKSSS